MQAKFLAVYETRISAVTLSLVLKRWFMLSLFTWCLLLYFRPVTEKKTPLLRNHSICSSPQRFICFNYSAMWRIIFQDKQSLTLKMLSCSLWHLITGRKLLEIDVALLNVVSLGLELCDYRETSFVSCFIITSDKRIIKEKVSPHARPLSWCFPPTHVTSCYLWTHWLISD